MSLRRMVFVGLHCVFLITKDGVKCIGGFEDEDPCYEEHLQAAVEYVATHPDTLLVLSGGMTRWAAGRVSEAEGALALLEYRRWFGHPEVKSRTITEDFAKTSYENFYYSIAAFRHHVGEYPSAGIVGVGWIQKRERYDLHRLAVGWPIDCWEYLGKNLPPYRNLQTALEGEKRTLEMVKADLYMRGPAWDLLRAQRNPFHQRHPYRELAPEMAEFFDFMEANSFRCRVPWAAIESSPKIRDFREAVTVL